MTLVNGAVLDECCSAGRDYYVNLPFLVVIAAALSQSHVDVALAVVHLNGVMAYIGVSLNITIRAKPIRMRHNCPSFGQ